MIRFLLCHLFNGSKKTKSFLQSECCEKLIFVVHRTLVFISFVKSIFICLHLTT